MQFIHADKEELKIYDLQPQVRSFDPYGYIYMQNNDSLKYAVTSGIWKNYNYFYEMKLNYTVLTNADKNKVLQIKNEDDFLKVTYKFGYLEQTPNFIDLIKLDWEILSNYYGGIEVDPSLKYLMNLTNNPEMVTEFKKHGWGLSDFGYTINITWLYAFDMMRGCFWVKNAIKNVKKIDKKKIKLFNEKIIKK